MVRPGVSSAKKAPTSSTVDGQNKITINNRTGEKVQMKRSLGVWNGIAIIIGVIVGSGIFISPRGVLMHAGSPGASLVVWCLCGLLALLGALCFAELGTSIASSGGEYTYIKLAYGPLPSFLYIWVIVLIIMPCGNAISALTFANYCLQPLFAKASEFVTSDSECLRPPEQALRLLALAILMILIYINCATVSGSIKLQGTFTLAKVAALALIIFYGIYYLLAGNPFRSSETSDGRHHHHNHYELVSNSTTQFDNNEADQTDIGTQDLGGLWTGTQTNLSQLARAFYSGFFTYSGWSSLNNATEEIKNPVKNMPRAIVISITSVTLIYILANTAYFAVLSKEQILGSDAIAVIFGEEAFAGLVSWLMPLVVALSTMGGLNASIFATSRLYFAAAREGQLFSAIEMINYNRLTPVPALIFLGLTSSIYLFTTKISTLIEYMTFVEASFAALGVSTMLTLRYKMPTIDRPLKVPIFVPLVYLAFSAAMLLLPLWSSPLEASIGIAITLTGLPVYYLTANWKQKPAAYQNTLDQFNAIAQKLTLSVVPTKEDATELSCTL